MEDNNTVFQQDLSKDDSRVHIFFMQLLMKEKCPMPEKAVMQEVLEKHLGAIESLRLSEKNAGFAAKNYSAEFEGKNVNPMLMISDCCDSNNEKIDDFTRSQMWDCPEHEKILSECGYQVVANDVLGDALNTADRAEMLMNFLEALIELYPTCEAVYFHNSGKLFTAEQIRSHDISGGSRFIYFAVNVRFFNIQGTDDMMIDTLGMDIVGLPNLQYHFHDFDPNDVVNHAYNMLSYIFENNCPIKSGDTIDGMQNGQMSMDVQWKCHFEDSLIQPSRPVIDICMNEFASGQREY